MSYNLFVKNQPKESVMAKRLLQVKRDYITHIAEFMYAHHISFKTLEQTKQTWRTERAYDASIEQELIDKSKLFLSLLDKELDLNFRRRLVNFMANYLAVYVSKSKEYANIQDAKARQNHAYIKLNNEFLIWLNGLQANKALRKTNKKPRKPVQTQQEPKYEKHLSKQGDKVIQEITFRNETIKFTYENMKEFRRNYRADIARIIGAHTK